MSGEDITPPGELLCRTEPPVGNSVDLRREAGGEWNGEDRSSVLKLEESAGESVPLKLWGESVSSRGVRYSDGTSDGPADKPISREEGPVPREPTPVDEGVGVIIVRRGVRACEPVGGGTRGGGM